MFVLEVCLFLLSLHPRLAEPTLSACLTSSARNSTRLLPAWQGGQLRAPLPGPRADFTLSRFRQEVRDTSFQCVIQSASALLEPEMSSSMTNVASRIASGPVACRQSNAPSQPFSERLRSGMQQERQGNPTVRIPRKRPLPPGAAMHVRQTKSPNPIPCDSVVKKYRKPDQSVLRPRGWHCLA